jgi:hypothetical protein
MYFQSLQLALEGGGIGAETLSGFVEVAFCVVLHL